MNSLVMVLFLFTNQVLFQPEVKRVRVDERELPYSGETKILLEPLQNKLLVEFSSKDSLSTRIIGLDENWTISPYPVLNIYGLSGGDYVLEAKTVNGQEESPVLHIPIIVKQAFWQKWWFWPSIILYILIIVGIAVYLFFLYDFRQKLKMQYVRNKIASDLHDEVGSNLNSIAIFAELLRKKGDNDPSLLPILDKISSNSEETVALMRDTVWSINPENDSIEKLLDRMRGFGIEILAAKGIVFTFTSKLNKEGVELNMEQRRNLYLIYKEAVNNIVKHSEAQKAFCVITLNSNLLQVIIRDEGIGFDSEKTFEGQGLRSFAMRGKEDDLRVSVQSVVGEGTEVVITVYA